MARGTIFNDKTRLEEMLALRMRGISVIQLGKLYDVDHTTIVYHCKRNGVGHKRELKTETVERKKREIPQKPPQKVITLHPILANERINRGLPSYADYIRAEEKRRYAHLRGLRKNYLASTM